MEVGDQVKYNPALVAGAAPNRRNKRGVVVRVWRDPSNIERVDVRFGENEIDPGVSTGQFVPWDDQ